MKNLLQISFSLFFCLFILQSNAFSRNINIQENLCLEKTLSGLNLSFEQNILQLKNQNLEQTSFVSESAQTKTKKSQNKSSIFSFVAPTVLVFYPGLSIFLSPLFLMSAFTFSILFLPIFLLYNSLMKIEYQIGNNLISIKDIEEFRELFDKR